VLESPAQGQDSPLFYLMCARAFDVDANYPYLSGSVIMRAGLAIGPVWVSQGRKDTTNTELPPTVDLILV
jgi:hypothetical protein